MSANSEQYCCEDFEFTHDLPVNQPLFIDKIDLFLIKMPVIFPAEENLLVAKVYCKDTTYEIKFYNEHNGCHSHLITVETDLNNKANYSYEQFDI